MALIHANSNRFSPSIRFWGILLPLAVQLSMEHRSMVARHVSRLPAYLFSHSLRSTGQSLIGASCLIRTTTILFSRLTRTRYQMRVLANQLSLTTLKK